MQLASCNSLKKNQKPYKSDRIIKVYGREKMKTIELNVSLFRGY